MIHSTSLLNMWISRISTCKDFLSRACAIHNLHLPKICVEECESFRLASSEIEWFVQKQSPEAFCKKRCPKKFRKIQRKTPEPCNFTNKQTLAQLFSCEFCEISKNTFFTEHFGRLLLFLVIVVVTSISAIL